MKTLITAVFLCAVILLASIWYFSNKNPHAEKARNDLTSAATETKQFVQDKVGSWNLNTDQIKDELAKTGQIVRQKAQQAGSAVSDATSDGRITAAIKAKYLKDPDLSAIQIGVSTSNGKVTLSGTTSSVDNVKKAIQLAMDTDGVHEVVSTIQVKS